MARCIRNGHTADDAWMMTPRQLKGWSDIYGHEDAARDRSAITLMRVAQHADAKGYKQFVKTLERDV